MNKKGIESDMLIKIILVIIFAAIAIKIVLGMLKNTRVI